MVSKKKSKEDKSIEKEVKETVNAFVHPKYPGLNSLKFAITGGIFYGLCVLATVILSLLGAYEQYTLLAMPWINAVYGSFGFTLSWWGAILGAVYGFVDGFIVFGLFAMLYNKLSR